MPNSKKPKISPHIQVIGLNNQGGSDFVVGDIHGCSTLLSKLIKTLKGNDRLFIVGDLIDRGENSIKVVNTIVEHNENYKKKTGKKEQQIYCVKGNHEEIFLRAMEYLRGERSNKKYFEALLKSGGAWIFKDKKFKKLSDKIFQDANNVDNSTIKKYKDMVSSKYKEIVNEKNIENIKQLVHWDEMEEMEKYIKSLPYVLVVGKDKLDSKSFVVCHADMPLSHDNLLKRDEKIGLTEKEIEHIIFYRPNETKLKVEKQEKNIDDSTVVIVGHNIVDGTNKNKSVRSGTHAHVNLDFGGFFKGMLVMLNVMTGKVSIIKRNDSDCVSNAVQKQITAIESHMKRVAASKNISTFVKPEELDKFITKEIGKCCNNTLKEKKQAYFGLVSWLLRENKITDQQKNDLGMYLLKQPNHLLKQERHHNCFFLSRKASHSNQTRTMHKVVNLLLPNQIQRQRDNKTWEIKDNEGNSHEFSRHVKQFR